MTEREALLTEYYQTAIQIEETVDTLSESALAHRERPSEWCIREIIHHLADVEIGDAMRLRQMVAHESPLIVAYDEGLFASRLHYDRRLSSSQAVYTILRTSNHEIVQLLEDDEWLRPGRHEEREQYTVEILVRRSIEHDHQHLAQIRRALESRGRF